MKLVAWFNEVGKNDVQLVGGKGANLGELTRAGLPVPGGFVVTSRAYVSFLEEAAIRPHLEGVLAGLDVAQHADLEDAAFRIKGIISAAAVPDIVEKELLNAFGNMSGAPIAVRSSATAEDLAEASFAGQQSTFLNVSGTHLARSVQDCWASLFEPQAIAYRDRRGIDHLEVGIAVVVQEMVQSQRSGVMFTVHPVTGASDKVVIEAVYGLGEACVSGVVTPDFYVVDKSSLNIDEKAVSHQERELVRKPNASPKEEANEWIPVAAGRAGAQKLTDEEISRIATLGRRVEGHYGAPQDIEWAEADGEFFIVQARPVTTLS